MPPSTRAAQAPDRRRNPDRFAAYELRAAVTERAYEWMDAQAKDLGRSRSWHVGLVVEAVASVEGQMSDLERAQLDALMRRPDELLEVLRTGMRSARAER